MMDEHCFASHGGQDNRRIIHVKDTFRHISNKRPKQYQILIKSGRALIPAPLAANSRFAAPTSKAKAFKSARL
jgi:hypothetical protein